MIAVSDTFDRFGIRLGPIEIAYHNIIIIIIIIYFYDITIIKILFLQRSSPGTYFKFHIFPLKRKIAWTSVDWIALFTVYHPLQLIRSK